MHKTIGGKCEETTSDMEKLVMTRREKKDVFTNEKERQKVLNNDISSFILQYCNCKYYDI